MKTKVTLVVEKKVDRLDQFLVQALKPEFKLSRSQIQKLITAGHVQVDGHTILMAKQALTVGAVVEILLVESALPSHLKPQLLELAILFEDPYFLVLNKPNNLVVHPGAGNPDGTLVNGLVYAQKNLSGIGGTFRPGIVHRLDKQTTGVLLVAKTDLVHQQLSEMFANHEVYKEYWALVKGVIKEEKGRIEAPIGRSDKDRKKMAVTVKNSKLAITNFEVLERYCDTTLVAVKPETGRTHQIRVHFQYINHPVLNDPVYGSSSRQTDEFGQFLHAYKLIFHHPVTHEKMEFTAPLPLEFNDKIKTLRLEGREN